jgi:hypothetical protein
MGYLQSCNTSLELRLHGKACSCTNNSSTTVFRTSALRALRVFAARRKSPNVRHNARGCAQSLEPLPTLYLASEANVISLVEV